MKKVLLALLPAFMLCSCAGNPLQFVEDAIEENAWANVIEDDDAHDEIFSKTPISFGERKNTGYSGDIGLGVQRTAIADGKLSVRFIAAVTLGVGDLADTTAVWTRAVYNGSDGTAIKASATKESTKAYTSLYDGGGELYTIEKYNTDHTTSHTHFVVYTLLNIPEDNVGDYITAYVTVDSKVSKVAATTVNLNTKFLMDKADLDDDDDHYFAVKKSGSTYTDVACDLDPGSDHAKISSLDLGIGDGFLLVHRDSGAFKVYGADGDTGGTNHFFGQIGSSEFMSALFDDSNVTVYLNDSDKIYISVNVCTATLYVNPNIWNTASAWFAAWSSAGDYWARFEQVGSSAWYSATWTFNPGMIIFVRQMPSDDPKYSSTNGGLNWDNKWNQTQDLTFDGNKDGFTVNGWDDGYGKSSGAWSVYSA